MYDRSNIILIAPRERWYCNLMLMTVFFFFFSVGGGGGVDVGNGDRLSDKHRLSYEKVLVGNDQEMAQSERKSHSKERGGKKSKLTIRYS